MSMNRKFKNIHKMAGRSMYSEGFQERTDIEQYFWTPDTVQRLIQGLTYINDCCCLTTPSLGHGFHEMGREEVVLDIDERFNYLPRFRYFDILSPYNLDDEFQVVVMDPPFFYIPMQEIYNAVMVVTKGNTNTKLLMGFLKREEPLLLEVFKDFNLKPTSFPLRYSTVKENKWRNYVLYSNVDLPGIKRGKPGFI